MEGRAGARAVRASQKQGGSGGLGSSPRPTLCQRFLLHVPAQPRLFQRLRKTKRLSPGRWQLPHSFVLIVGHSRRHGRATLLLIDSRESFSLTWNLVHQRFELAVPINLIGPSSVFLLHGSLDPDQESEI